MKELLKSLVQMLPNKLQIWINFKVRLGYFPNLKKPRSFNEKIQYRKMYDNNPLFIICSDKHAVREYVKSKVGAKYLIPLLYIGDDISKDDLLKIDCDIVVKTTHDSGGIAIVKQSDRVDYDTIISNLKKSLKHNFGKQVMESWYSKIPPKIIVEKMLKKENGNPPNDYKIHVFNRKDKVKVIIGVDYDRFTEQQSRSFYDENGNLLSFGSEFENHYLPLGDVKNFKLMVTLAKKLSEDFDYVRVDFFNCQGDIFFGELTFAPGSGFTLFSERKYDFELGSYWEQNINKGVL